MTLGNRFSARPLVLLTMLAFAWTGTAWTGAAAAAPAPESPTEAAQLRVYVVIHRSLGDREISLPYSFLVGEHSSRLRAGLRVPILEGQQADGSGGAYRFQEIGTSMDCSAKAMGDGRYRLSLAVETSSLAVAPEGEPAPVPDQAMADGAPIVRTFTVVLDPVLADGESTRVVAATDPISGENVGIELRLEVP